MRPWLQSYFAVLVKSLSLRRFHAIGTTLELLCPPSYVAAGHRLLVDDDTSPDRTYTTLVDINAIVKHTGIFCPMDGVPPPCLPKCDSTTNVHGTVLQLQQYLTYYTIGPYYYSVSTCPPFAAAIVAGTAGDHPDGAGLGHVPHAKGMPQMPVADP